MKSLFFACIIGLCVAACGATTQPAGGSGASTPATPWTNTAMQSLVQSRCASSGCHDGTVKPNFAGISEGSMRAYTEALAAVQTGRMPQNGALSASELATFQAFYQ